MFDPSECDPAAEAHWTEAEREQLRNLSALGLAHVLQSKYREIEVSRAHKELIPVDQYPHALPGHASSQQVLAHEIRRAETDQP